ncbi:MAG: Uma2 family endonuclease [Gemmataceae bacterium]|nr:Uma2 family endonuclease [Gemmataceae bacterium]MCI0741433.1 Uma2 family endonuclease [Gemmataceae bacterium]
MATVATKPMTAEEFYEFTHRSENRDRLFELERGEVVEKSRPGKRHGLVCANGAGILRDYAKARKKGYVCSNDTGIVVERDPDSVRGPDIAYFEDARTIDDVEEKYGDTPPLLTIEVMSPNDNITEVMLRIKEQLMFGVKIVWLIDPEKHAITVYRLDKLFYQLKEHEEITGEDVLPDFRCKVAEFFTLPGQ